MFQEEPISVGYFVACLVFLIMPSLFFMIMRLAEGFDSWSCSCSQLKRISLTILYSVVTMITLPLQATILSGANLILGDDNMVEKKMEELAFSVDNMVIVDHMKFFEILGSRFWANYIFSSF